MQRDSDYEVDMEEEGDSKRNSISGDSDSMETADSSKPSARTAPKRSRSVPGRGNRRRLTSEANDADSSTRSTRLSVNPELAAKHRRFLNRVSNATEDSQDDDSSSTATRKKRSRSQSKLVATEKEDSDDNDSSIASRKRRRRSRSRQNLGASEDANQSSTTVRKRRSRSSVGVRKRRSRSRTGAATEKEDSDEDGDSSIGVRMRKSRSRPSLGATTEKEDTDEDEDSSIGVRMRRSQSRLRLNASDKDAEGTFTRLSRSRSSLSRLHRLSESSDSTSIRGILKRNREQEDDREGEEGDNEDGEEEGEDDEKENVVKTPQMKKRASDTVPKPLAEGLDMFCWKCHRENAAVGCRTCPRVFHLRCLPQDLQSKIISGEFPTSQWMCPECKTTVRAESFETRSIAMKSITLDQLGNLLKFTLARMKSVAGSEWFYKPVDLNEFPAYSNYIVNPMDLGHLEKNIRQKRYGSTHAFFADCQWLLHNSVVFNTHQSSLTSIAKCIVKICKQELDEIETCPECYLNAHTRKDSWFVEVCKRPHPLVWAKLKGFPFWPAKAMKTNSDNLVDVRFFGAHDRAWIPMKQVYLYSKLSPGASKNRRKNQYDDCMEEVNLHIKKLRDKYGEFVYPPFKSQFDASKEEDQLEAMLPGYKAASRRHGRLLGPVRNFSTPVSSSTPTPSSYNEVAKESNDSQRKKIPEKNRASLTSLRSVRASISNDGDERTRRASESESVPGSDENRDQDQDQAKPDSSATEKTNMDSDVIKVVETVETSNNESESSVKDEIANEYKKKSSSIDDVSVRNDKIDENESPVVSQPTEESAISTIGTAINSTSHSKPDFVDSLREKMQRLTNESSKSNDHDYSLAIESNADVNKKNDDDTPKSSEKQKSGEKKVDNDDDCGGSSKEEDAPLPVKNDNKEVGRPNDSECAPASIDLCSEDEEKSEDDEVVPKVNENATCQLMATDAKKPWMPKIVSVKSAINFEPSKNDVEGTKPLEQVSEKAVVDTISAVIEEVVRNPSLMGKRSDSGKRLTDIVDTLNGGTEESDSFCVPSGTCRSPTKSVTQDVQSDASSVIEEESMDIDNPRMISLLKARDPEELERVFSPSRRKGFPSKVRRNGSNASSCSSDMSSVEELKRICAEQEAAYAARLGDQGESSGRKRAAKTPVDELVAEDGYSVLDEVSGQFTKKKKEENPNVTITLVSDDEASSGKGTSPEKSSSAKDQSTRSIPTVSLSRDVSLSIVREDTSNRRNSKDLCTSLDMECVESDAEEPPVSTDKGSVSVEATIKMKSTARKTFSNTMSMLKSNSELSKRMSSADIQAAMNNHNASSASSPKGSPIPPNSAQQQNGGGSSIYSKISQIAANSPAASEVQISNTMSLKIQPVDPSTAKTLQPVDSSVLMNGAVQTMINAVAGAPAVVLPQLQLKPPTAATGGGNSMRGNFGPATGRMDSISQKLAGNMMSMMEDMLNDMANEGRPEARVQQMQLELERTQWKLRQELAEYKHNTDLIMMEMRSSLEADKHRAVLETRMKCQAEKELAINETKMKQWCALCKKEALFYCCWNTAYCNYPCQQEHWPQHMANCAQTSRPAEQVNGPKSAAVKMIAPFQPVPKTVCYPMPTQSVPRCTANNSAAASAVNNVPHLSHTYPGPKSKTNTHVNQAQFIRQGGPFQ